MLFSKNPVKVRTCRGAILKIPVFAKTWSPKPFNIILHLYNIKKPKEDKIKEKENTHAL